MNSFISQSCFILRMKTQSNGSCLLLWFIIFIVFFFLGFSVSSPHCQCVPCSIPLLFPTYRWHLGNVNKCNMKSVVTRNTFHPEPLDKQGQLTQTGGLLLQIHCSVLGFPPARSEGSTRLCICKRKWKRILGSCHRTETRTCSTAAFLEGARHFLVTAVVTAREDGVR